MTTRERNVYFVQHRDVVATKQHFAGLPPDVLYVRSQFPTLQGEGPLVGQHAYFVRLAGCNYGPKGKHCQFCDTDFQISRGENRTFHELRTAWQEAQCNIVVLTGGEPTLQHNIIGLIRANPHVLFQIETNGSQSSVVDELLGLLNCVVVISPKWSESGNMILPTTKMLRNASFKFLHSADFGERDNLLPAWYTDIAQPFYISPIAVYARAYEGEVVSAWEDGILDRQATRRNYASAARRVIELAQAGFQARLSIQQHIFTAIP